LISTDAEKMTYAGSEATFRNMTVDRKPIDYKNMRTNIWYLVSLTLCMGFSSGMMGFGICAGGQAFTALKHQFDWKDDKDKVNSHD